MLSAKGATEIPEAPSSRNRGAIFSILLSRVVCDHGACTASGIITSTDTGCARCSWTSLLTFVDKVQLEPLALPVLTSVLVERRMDINASSASVSTLGS